MDLFPAAVARTFQSDRLRIHSVAGDNMHPTLHGGHDFVVCPPVIFPLKAVVDDLDDAAHNAPSSMRGAPSDNGKCPSIRAIWRSLGRNKSPIAASSQTP